MTNTKKYISVVEAISLLAYGETERLSKILDAEAKYLKWKISGSENLPASFQRLADGHEPEEETDKHAASLVIKYEKSAQELRAELEQDMRIRGEYPYEHECVEKAQNRFIKAVRCGLRIDGVQRGGNGKIEEIPTGFIGEDNYRINIYSAERRNRNTFCFVRKEGQPISRNDAEESNALYEWEYLRVLEEDVRRIISGAKIPASLGRPSPKSDIEQQLMTISSDDNFWKLPRKTQAKVITEKCGKKAGERGWGDRAVQNHISKYEGGA